MPFRTPLAYVALFLAAWAILAAAGAIRSALAHDALPTAAQPQGWSYPLSCCSSIDCRAVGDDKITEGPTGYTVPSGEVIAMTDSRIKESPDGVFHWCSVAGKDDGRTICLFVPPRSY